MGKLIKELQKLFVSRYSAPPPEKLTHFADFALWEARCKDYLQYVDAKAQSGAILALLDDEVYDLDRSTAISAALTPSVVLDGLHEILGSYSRSSNVNSNSRGVDKRIPVGHTAPRSKGFTHHGRNSPEHSGAGAVRRWSPRPPNPKGASVGSAIGPRQGPYHGSLGGSSSGHLRATTAVAVQCHSRPAPHFP
ncbi:unnamed protein product [Schistocephalus solidus]|uniref:Uncharacterized protein n=1 Tax=Schistocephalus solidus TaxID=70667 RepID=A0A183TBK8_SCHSO|nr:unnamed protein product [Schistocephalus solidus]